MAEVNVQKIDELPKEEELSPEGLEELADHEGSAEEDNDDQEEESCGFCLQKLTYMIEPKQLPCSHIFCLPCLEEDAKKDCPVCMRVYDAEWTGMKDLLPNEKSREKREVNTEHIKCDVCKELKGEAVCYCLGCEQKLCDEHFKLHEQSKMFFTTKHEQIDISEYSMHKAIYKTKFCVSHETHRVVSACYNCNQIFCEKCKPDSYECPSSTTRYGAVKGHETDSIAMIGGALRRDLKVKLKVIADKVTEGLNIEKKVWRKLDDAECDVTEMKTVIVGVVDEAVQELRKSADVMIEQLGAHQNCLADSVEEYSASLREKRDQLDSTWRSTCRELQMSTATEVITKHKVLDRKIVSVHPCEYSPEPQLSQIMLVKTSRVIESVSEALTSEMLLTIPNQYKLVFKSSVIKENEECLSVDWTKEELLWITSEGNLWSRQLADNRETAIQLSAVGRLDCIRGTKDHKVALLSSTSKLSVRISHRPSLSNAKSIICSYPKQKGILAHMSVSDTHIAVCDNEMNVVRIFNSRGTEIGQFGRGLLGQPFGVFLHKDSVFVSDMKGGSLYKFKLYDITDKQDTVWVCHGLAKPSGICVDRNGLIHVASGRSGLIYLISSQGILLTTLTCKELTNTKGIYDIRISPDGGTLASACRNEGIKLFTIRNSDK